MSQRFYPRNAQARAAHLAREGAQSGPLVFPRNDQSLRDGLAVGMGNALATVAATGNPVLEAEVVAGGEAIVLTIVGNDRFVNAVAMDSAENAALIAGLPTSGGIKAALAFGNFALSADGKALTVTLPAVGAYSITEDASYDWAIPASCFKYRPAAYTVVGAIQVTNGA